MTLARIISLAYRIGPGRAALIAALLLGITAESRHLWRRHPPRPRVTPATSAKASEQEIGDPCGLRSESEEQVAGGKVRIYDCASDTGKVEFENVNGQRSTLETNVIQSTRWIRRDNGWYFLLLITDGGRGTGWWTTEQILLCFDRSKIDPILKLTESQYTLWDTPDDPEHITIEDTQLHLVSNLSFENWPILRTHTIKQTDYFRDPGDDHKKRRPISHSIVTTGEAEYRFDPRIWKYRRVWQRGSCAGLNDGDVLPDLTTNPEASAPAPERNRVGFM